MTKNVLIPIPLVKRIIELLEYWDLSRYDRVIRDEYGVILQALNVKMQKLEIRDAYTKMIVADNVDSRFDARINYLWQKRHLHGETSSNYPLV